MLNQFFGVDFLFSQALNVFPDIYIYIYRYIFQCKFCDSTFPSRGYMMTHQRNDHPKELKALQERRKSKKAQKAAS